MALISAGSIAKALWPGVNTWFGMGYNEYEKQFPYYMNIEQSEQNFEEDVNVYGTGLMPVKPEGQNITYDEMAQGFLQRYVHIVYGLGYIITREQIEDNLYMKLAEQRTKALAFSARQTKETVCANVLNRAFNSSFTFADGLEMCSTVHLKSKGGTFANELATAADLSETALEQAQIDIMAFTDDAGNRISAQPKRLIVHRNNCFEAERLLMSVLRPGTADNDINATRNKGLMSGGYKVVQYLSDEDAWFITTDVPNGLKLLERRAVQMENDTDFDSDNMKFKCTERFSTGITDPRGIFGSPGV